MVLLDARAYLAVVLSVSQVRFALVGAIVVNYELRY